MPDFHAKILPGLRIEMELDVLMQLNLPDKMLMRTMQQVLLCLKQAVETTLSQHPS